MPITIPSQAVLCDVFSRSSPFAIRKTHNDRPARTRLQARHDVFSAWSTVEDAKRKTAQLSDAAVKEFEKASSAAQAKTGKIELYSPKFYAACTFGGLLACV
jgi:solute carrier family 25 (mitochondrial phosphate transporter), member 3